MSDLIDRQAAIDVIDKIFPVDPMRNDYTKGITCGAALAKVYIKQLPSAEPLTEEDYTELRDRFGEYVEFVVRDMITGKGERWKT